MAILIILALIALPFIEISIFIEAGRALSIPGVLGLTILTAVGGLAIVRVQGLNNFRRMQQAMDRGEPPIAEIVHGTLLFVAGVFLLIPGFLTDAVGALLLLPPVRALIGAGFFRMLERRVKRRSRQDDVIDAEFWEEDDTETYRARIGNRHDRPDDDEGTGR